MRPSFFNSAQHIAQKNDIRPYPPSFKDESLEQEVRSIIRQDNLVSSRIAIAVGAFALIVFAIASWYYPDSGYPRIRIVLALLFDLLAFLILFWITFTTFGKKHLPNLLGFSLIWFSVSISLNNIFRADPEIYSQYFIGIILLVFTGYIFIRSNWYIPLLTGFFIHVFYLLISPFSGTPSIVLIQNNIYLMMANIIGSLVNYNMEFIIRREFWQQKQLEKQRTKLAQANLELDAIIDQQTNELRNSNAFMSNLANGAAKDLMAPLYSTIGYFELIVERNQDVMDSTSQNFVSEVYRQGARLKDMLESLVEYSRLQESEKRHTQVDVNMTIRIVLQRLKPVIKEKNARITIEPLPVVNGDEVQLVTLFQNLIENALQFNGNTPPEIKIDADYDLDAERWVFSVEDQGIGIAKANQSRLFEFFTRLSPESELTRIGMGLAICKRIVDLHGGKIWVESQPGKGTTFHLTLHE